MPPQTRSRITKPAQCKTSRSEEARKATPSHDSADEDSRAVSPSNSSSSNSSRSAAESNAHSSPSSTSSAFATPALASPALRMSYAIGPGETGVLTFEPYKSALLPLWRFRDEDAARASAAALTRAFAAYLAAGDFVGADMARKFLQMGMTRAARYANYAGGRKYERGSSGGGEKQAKAKSAGHAGQAEKLAAKAVFRAAWLRAKEEPRYAVLREEWRAEKRAWEKRGGKLGKPGKPGKTGKKGKDGERKSEAGREGEVK